MLPSAFRTWNWRTGLLAALTGVQLGPLRVPRPSVRVCPEEPSPWRCLPAREAASVPRGLKPPFAVSGRSAPGRQTGHLGLCHVLPRAQHHGERDPLSDHGELGWPRERVGVCSPSVCRAVFCFPGKVVLR